MIELPQTHYTRSGDVNLAYQIIGEGDPDIVFIPGWVTNIEEIWQLPEPAAWLRRLAGFGRLILFDKRGTGLSDRVHEDQLPSLDQRMEDLRAILRAAGSTRAAFLGLSEGVPLALLLAARHPELVSHLILYAGFARWLRSDEFPHGLSRNQHEQTLQAIIDTWGSAFGLHLMAPSAAAEPEVQAGWARFLRQSASPGAAAAFYRMNMDIDVRSALQHVQAPTLILHRAEDRLIEVEQSRYIARHIPQAQYVEFPGSDHLPWFGDITPPLAAIQTFLLGAEARASTPQGELASEDIAVFYQLRDYLQRNYSRELRLSDLCRRFGLNEYKLKRGFKALFDSSVMAYLSEVRLDNARRLLLETDLPVAEVADAVGYPHANNFSAAFKRRFGMTPSQVRQ